MSGGVAGSLGGAVVSAADVVALLQCSDGVRVVQQVDAFLRSLREAKYLLSSTLFPTFALLLHRLLSPAPPSSAFPSSASPAPTPPTPSPTLPSSSSSDGSLLPLVAITGRAWDLLLPSGSLFQLLFFHSSFPPLYQLPVAALPPGLQRRVTAAVAGDEAGGESDCPVAELYRGGFLPSASAVQLGMAEFFFFALALFLVRDEAPVQAAMGRRPAVGGGGGGFSTAAPLPAPYGPAEMHRGYLQVVEALLHFFLPLPASPPSLAPPTATAASAASSLPLQRVYGPRLLEVLGEVWMGDSVGDWASLDAEATDGSFGGPALSPSTASFPLSSSPASSHSPSLASVDCVACVGLLVRHVLALPRQTGQRREPPLKTAGGGRGGGRPTSSLSRPSLFSSLPLTCYGLDALLFRFVYSGLSRPPALFDERLQALVALWLSVLSAAAGAGPAASSASSPSSTSPSPQLVSAYFAFFSPLVLLFLRALVSCDVGREGSTTRLHCLTQALQLMRALEPLQPLLAQVERSVLSSPSASFTAAESRRGEAGLRSRALLPSSAADEAAEDARSQFIRLTASAPEDALVATWSPAPSATSPSPSPFAALTWQALRLTTPSSLREGDDGGLTAASQASTILPPLTGGLPSTAASLSRSASASFRSLLVQEERTWRLWREAALRLCPAPPPDEAEGERRDRRPSPTASPSSSPAPPLPPPPRSLSPERLSSDPFHRLTASGRSQLKAGVRLCSRRNAAALQFVGSQWDRPCGTEESRLAVEALRSLHKRLLDSGWGVTEQWPLRLLARIDVLLTAGLLAALTSALLFLRP